MAGEQVEHVVEEADARGERAAAASPSRSRLTCDVGLAGRAAQLCAVRLMRQRFSRIRARIDSACTAKPSASAIGTPARASAAAASPMRTSVIRRRKWRDGQAGGEARRAVGRQRVVRARDVVAERGRARGADEQAAGARDARRERLGGRADELAGARARAPRRTPARPRGPSASTSTFGPAATVGAVAEQRLQLAPDGVEQRRVVGDRDDERVVAVLGLREQVERDAGADRRPRRRSRAGRSGPAKPSMPTRPETWRLASCT